MGEPKFGDEGGDGEHGESDRVGERDESSGRRSGERGDDGRGVISSSNAVCSTLYSTSRA